jgi:TolB protein
MDSDGSNIKQLTFNNFHTTQPEWSPDGKSIIYIAYHEGFSDQRELPDPEVFMMQSDGTNQFQLTNNDMLYEKSLSWSPVTDLIAIEIGNPNISRHSLEIYLMNDAGEILEQLTSSENNIRPKWSPDGKSIVFKNYNNPNCSGINILNIETLSQHCIVIENKNELIGGEDPSWSPDGKFIIFSSGYDGDRDLYIMEADGTNVRKITNLPGDELSPDWAK